MKNIQMNFKSLMLTFIMMVGSAMAVHAADIKTDSVKVYGNCGMCQKRIITAASVKGVKYVQWDMKTQMLTVKYDAEKVTLEQIEKNIAKVGHATENVEADKDAYKSLHHCCQYAP